VNHAVALRKQFIDIVKKADGDRGRARIYTHTPPGGEHTNLHSKIWIIDDEFVLMGSANCNQRSLTHDSEICAAIADEPRFHSCGLSLAQRLRIALWAEHLGMDNPSGHAELVDGVAAGVHWLKDQRPRNARFIDHDTGTNESGIIGSAWSTLLIYLPGFACLKIVKIVDGLWKLKNYLVEPASVPVLFEPLGSCPDRVIHRDGTAEFGRIRFNITTIDQTTNSKSDDWDQPGVRRGSF
jgi:hypothetical protein